MKTGIALKAISVALLGLGFISMPSYAADEAAMVAPQQVEKGQMTGEKFLEMNKQKQGVVVLPDGLQYEILTSGQGEKPVDGDLVTVDYSGTLIDGTEFDSSYKRGQPATFPVNGVIPGWTEALKLMKVGSTWKLYIPASLAYGEQGAPPAIGPNQTLIFKVHLISIQKENGA